ncbi:coat protein [Lake Sarah-associated circular virus-8]|uniref:coat protein n=1 Tax=Lake Sarah-associated circular virus-8 TaxID=1685785 RepID=UPI000776B738|nr:coat protein [Lake Sarah-associated circular virus-8]ALE29601.1 coat protein [Lake Sarah-associated circular virus-8]ALE29602.1 coat protein [Lake Sarah-associated circular virus-8]
MNKTWNTGHILPYLSAAGTAVQLGWNAWKNQGYGSYELSKEPEKKMGRFRQRKRQRRGRFNVRRRKSRIGGLRRRIRKINRTLFTKGVKSIEVKYRFSTADGRSTSSWSSASTWDHITDIATGSGPTSRVGSKVFLRHLNLRMHVRASKTVPAENEQYVRVMVVRHSNIQVTPNWSAVSSIPDLNILFEPALANDLDYQMLPFKRINNRYSKGFKVLYSKMVKVSKETGADYEQRIWKARIPIMKPCQWGNTDATGITDVGPGQIVIYCWDNEPSALAADHPLVKVGGRLSWTDV